MKCPNNEKQKSVAKNWYLFQIQLCKLQTLSVQNLRIMLPVIKYYQFCDDQQHSIWYYITHLVFKHDVNVGIMVPTFYSLSREQ